MKIIKKILALSLFLTVITAATSANSAILKKNDCTAYKTLSHEWNMCKLGSKKFPAGGGETGETSELTNDNDNDNGEKKQKKKKSWNFFKKIKNFGGKNIGEEG